MSMLRDRAWASVVVMAAAVALVHGRYVGFGFTSLDDLTLIVHDQPLLTATGALWRAFGRTYFHVIDQAHAYYRPVVTASYALDASVFGVAPSGYHATNVLLHLVATGLLHALLVRARLRKEVALVAALVFAVHPALVQAVAWVPGRNDLLLGVFALLAVITHARAVAAPTSRGAVAWRGAHLASFALAMFTKETAIVVPLVALAWTRLVERPEGSTRSRNGALATWVGWTLVIGAFGSARHCVLEAAGASTSLDWRAPMHHLSVLVSSAGKILLPVSLAPIATIDDTASWPGVAAVLVLLVLLVLLVRRGGKVRSPVIAFGAIVYVLALAPTLFTPGSLVLENRLYLPAVGMIIVIAELADKARLERGVAIAIGSVTTLALAALTFGYASAYRDPLAFGKAAVKGSPTSPLAHFTLGQARQLRGELEAAIGEYATALALDPNEPIVHNNLAVIHMKRGDWARAQAELEAELRVNPGYGVAVENLSIVRRRLAAE